MLSVIADKRAELKVGVQLCPHINKELPIRIPTRYLLDIYFLFLQLTIFTVTSLTLADCHVFSLFPRLRSIGLLFEAAVPFAVSEAAAVFYYLWILVTSEGLVISMGQGVA
jgi:hypothetical protein